MILFYMAETMAFNGISFCDRPSKCFSNFIRTSEVNLKHLRNNRSLQSHLLVFERFTIIHAKYQKTKKNICYHLKSIDIFFSIVCIEIENFLSIEDLCDSSFKFYLGGGMG